MSDILAWIEFNALHSEHDKLTKTMLAMAAEEIRQVRHERNHWRRMLLIEEAGTRTARADARRLEERIAELLALRTEPDTPA